MGRSMECLTVRAAEINFAGAGLGSLLIQLRHAPRLTWNTECLPMRVADRAEG